MLNARNLSLLVVAFFAVIVVIVFQQIATSMTEQGIASGGPYNNGAAYPRAVSIVIIVLVLGQTLMDRFGNSPAGEADEPVVFSDLHRPALLLLVFAIYLGLLKTLGYHLTTAPLVLAIMWICGARNIGKLLSVALVMAFSFAFVFENFLSVVLPGGVFRLNIPW